MNPALIIIRKCAYTFNNSVSHHDGCRLVHPDMWYHLNAIHPHDGCRLVHPVKWDISSMPYVTMVDADSCIPPSGTLENFGFAFITDTDWCIPSGGSFDISFNSHL